MSTVLTAFTQNYKKIFRRPSGFNSGFNSGAFRILYYRIISERDIVGKSDKISGISTKFVGFFPRADDIIEER